MTGTLTQAPPAAAVRLAALAQSIAEGTCDLPPAVIAARVEADADPALRGLPLADAWDRYLYAVMDEHAIENGLTTWQAIQDDLECSDRTNVACEITRERSADALAVLTGRDGGQQA